MTTRKILYVLISIAVLTVLSVPLWLKVDLLPMRLWDESRNAVNAIEMYQTNNWLVRTYNYAPETYELKPPLLTWFQVGSLHLFGLNELGIRMPSVVFSICSLILLFFLVFKMTKNYIVSLLASVITATSAGFYAEHTGRFGDHEALLVFIIVWLFYNVYSYSISRQTKYVYMAGASVALGILCKSIAIGMVLPGLVLFLLIDKKLLGLLRNKHTYIALLASVAPVCAYYYLRELAQPGYLDLVWHGELFPRFFNTSKDMQFKDAGFGYYFELLQDSKMEYWVWSFVLILLVPIVTKKIDRKWMFWVVTSMAFLLTISSGTKNFWYLAPVVPMLAGAVALSVYLIVQKNILHALWLTLPVFILTFFSYTKAYDYAFYPDEKYFEWETHGISYYLKSKSHIVQLFPDTEILLDSVYGFEPHMFYLEKMNFEKGIKIKRTQYDSIALNSVLLVSHQSTFQKLEKTYAVTMIDSSQYGTRLLRINAKKNLVQIDSVSQLSSVK